MTEEPKAVSTAKSNGETSPPKQYSQAWNILSIGLLVATVIVLGFYSFLFFVPDAITPDSALSFLMPPTLPATLSIPTRTASPPILETPLPPTATHTPDQSTPPTPTVTPQLATADPSLITPGSGTATRRAPYPFATQSTPVPLNAALFNPNHGCNWTGIAGQITDLNGNPIVGIQVRLVGIFNKKYLDYLTLSGTAPIYGPSGYEFTLGEQPLQTNESVWLQLVEVNGIPLSERVYIKTYAECDKNLLLLNFVQVR